MAARSAVIPSLETLPLTQCHQVRGLAESGGEAKPCSKPSSTCRLFPAGVRWTEESGWPQTGRVPAALRIKAKASVLGNFNGSRVGFIGAEIFGILAIAVGCRNQRAFRPGCQAVWPKVLVQEPADGERIFVRESADANAFAISRFLNKDLGPEPADGERIFVRESADALTQVLLLALSGDDQLKPSLEGNPP